MKKIRDFQSCKLAACLWAVAVCANAQQPPPASQPTDKPLHQNQEESLTPEQQKDLQKLRAGYNAIRDVKISVLDAKIKRLQIEIAKAKEASIERGKKLQQLKAERGEWEKRLRAVIPTITTEVGAVGVLPEDQSTLQIQQILGDNEALVSLPGSTVFYRFCIPTAGLATKVQVDLSGTVWKVTGTKTYETVTGGTNTVYVFEGVDPIVVNVFRADFEKPKKKR